MQRSAYVTGLGVCLPNAPVGNDEIEQVLGLFVVILRRQTPRAPQQRHQIAALRHRSGRRPRHAQQRRDDRRSRPRRVQVRRSLARRHRLPRLRHFVRGPAHFQPCQHGASGARLSAVRGCRDDGVCCAGVSAFKYGFLNVASGFSDTAVATDASSPRPACARRTSSRGRAASPEDRERPETRFRQRVPALDAVGRSRRLFITAATRRNGPSLRIDWVDLISFASQSDVCMYLGMRKTEAGRFESYRSADDGTELLGGGFLNLAQDVRMLADVPPEADAGGTAADSGATRLEPRSGRLAAAALFVAVVPAATL